MAKEVKKEKRKLIDIELGKEIADKVLKIFNEYNLSVDGVEFILKNLYEAHTEAVKEVEKFSKFNSIMKLLKDKQLNKDL